MLIEEEVELVEAQLIRIPNESSETNVWPLKHKDELGDKGLIRLIKKGK